MNILMRLSRGCAYKELGVSMNSSREQIKQAYYRMAKEHHPDSGGCQQKFKKINQAYSILSDQQKKHDYDRARARAEAEQKSGPSQNDQNNSNQNFRERAWQQQRRDHSEKYYSEHRQYYQGRRTARQHQPPKFALLTPGVLFLFLLGILFCLPLRIRKQQTRRQMPMPMPIPKQNVAGRTPVASQVVMLRVNSNELQNKQIKNEKKKQSALHFMGAVKS